jgi:CheY-like chemotaxis protein
MTARADYHCHRGASNDTIERMKNILLILENKLEFNLTKTVLQKLGFNVLSLQMGTNMHEALTKSFPDLVVTSVLGTQDEFLNEFIQVRQKRGTPKFIWVGPVSRLDKLKTNQRQLIDASLSTPIQPDVLIQIVCKLFELDPVEYLQKYRSMMGMGGQDVIKVSGQIAVPTSAADPIRAEKYKKLAQNTPKLDKVFSVKDLDKHMRKDEATENTVDQLEKKRKFVKALLK